MTNGTRRGWGVSVTLRPLSTPGKEPVPILQEAGWAPGSVWTGAENFAFTGIWSLDLPSRSQSLYRLSYPAYAVIYTFCDINLLKPTGQVMHHRFNIQQLYVLPHPVFMCFVFIWEQTATCATCSINWLVFITEMKSVYSAVRTGSLNKAICASSLKG